MYRIVCYDIYCANLAVKLIRENSMPITFNSILLDAGIDPSEVRLIRHKDNSAKKGLSPYELWRDDRIKFDIYQSIQGFNNRKILSFSYWAVFIVDENNKNMFAGLYSASYKNILEKDTPCPHKEGVEEAGTRDVYDLKLQESLSSFIGKLFIDWGLGYVAWIQHAAKNDKIVSENKLSLQLTELITDSGRNISLAKGTGRISNLISVSSSLNTENIHQAVEEYIKLDGEIDTYKDSTTYDVIVENEAFPPKAILGLALSNLLGAKILSKHFTAGLNSECFNIFENLGFKIKIKVKRENETFEYSKFVIGDTYTKLDGFKLGGVTLPKQVRDITGITRFINCVVLFVTLNKEDKEDVHKYRDTFLLGGKVFQWESQNVNTPATPHMMMIINQAPVVLFARVHQKVKNKTEPFVYVGQLSCNKYSYPKDSKSIPVEVIFDVIEHQPLAPNVLSEIYLWVKEQNNETNNSIDVSEVILTETEAPNTSSRKEGNNNYGKSNSTQIVDWAQRDELNRNLGLAGEELVIKYEKHQLISKGLIELANQVKHVALDNPSAGYDIKSFDEHGVEKYIEVKTTKKSKGTAFFISRNEVDVSRKLGDHFWIYRVYALNKINGKANFYPLNGSVEDHFELVPESYKAYPK
jgi:hypothetical protein